MTVEALPSARARPWGVGVHHSTCQRRRQNMVVRLPRSLLMAFGLLHADSCVARQGTSLPPAGLTLA
jgi:hypothetical protein